MKTRLQKIFLYAVLVAVFGIVIINWWQFSGTLLSSGHLESVLLSLARLAGLLTAVLLLVQVTLIGRAVWVESVFGLDKLSRVHRANGYIILGLILVHPFLMVLTYARINEAGFFAQLLGMLGTSIYLLLAFSGYLILLTTIGFAIMRKRLKYETWYFVHLFNYAAIALIFWHQIQASPEVLQPWFRTFWYVLHLVVLGNVLWFRITKPIIDYNYYKFTITRVVDLGVATAVYFTSPNLKQFRIRAGQFMIFRFLQKGFWWQAHPFSLSIGPGGHELRITAKKLGDYTNTLPQLRVGTKVFLSGPHGVFTEQRIRGQKLLFIAGGIGITPIRSLLESLGNRYPDKILLYSNKTPRETVFADELAGLSRKFQFPIINIYSDELVADAEYGRLDKTMLARLVPDLVERDVFLCGPPAMMDALKTAMSELGLPKKQLHWERFAL